MHRREQAAIGGMTDARTKVLTLLKEMESTDLYDVAKQELDRAAEAIETEFHENVVAPLTTRLKNRNEDNEFAKNLARGIDLSEKALSDAENTQVRRGEVAGTAERYIDGCGRMIVRKRPIVPFGVNPETRDSEPFATPIEDSGGGTIHRYYLDWTYAAQNTDIHGQCGKISLGAESSNLPLREQLIELNRAFRGVREADLETLDLSFPSIRNALCERKRDDSFNQPSSPQEQIVLRWHRAHPHRQIELRRNTRGFVVIGLACCGEDTKSDQICENIAALLSDLVRTQVRTPFHALMSLQPRDGVVYIPPAFVPPVRIAPQVPMEAATLGQAVSAILDNGIQADQQDEFGLPSTVIRTLADRYRRVLHENLDALDQIQNAIDVSRFQKER